MNKPTVDDARIRWEYIGLAFLLGMGQIVAYGVDGYAVAIARARGTACAWYVSRSDFGLCGSDVLVASLISLTAPQHAVGKDDCWYAVHCDYFKRRVEAPDKLCRCGAHQAKDKNNGGQNGNR